MEAVYKEHISYLDTMDVLFRRDLSERVDWNERLIFIKGARGVGKTTLILQYIKERFGYDSKALYVTMDSMTMANISLIELATYHFVNGGTHLFIDEIHKYENWSQELKNINDKHKKLHVIVSGSSMLQLYKGNADLSRRAVSYELYGLSLREYINVEGKQTIKKISLEDILTDHVTIAVEINKIVNPVTYLKKYMANGYYPFYLEGIKSFHQKLNNAINLSLETDLPLVLNVNVHNLQKIKKLLYFIAVSVPFKPNMTQLAGSLDLNRQTLNTYLRHLHDSGIISLLWDESKTFNLLAKPEKIYLNNPNLCHLVPQAQINIGNLRETFFMNQLACSDHMVFAAKKGDFLIDHKYLFEIGGHNKKFGQIADLPDSYLAVDDQLHGAKKTIPLWLFGFLG
jgi:uncharacterized protein